MTMNRDGGNSSNNPVKEERKKKRTIQEKVVTIEYISDFIIIMKP